MEILLYKEGKPQMNSLMNINAKILSKVLAVKQATTIMKQPQVYGTTNYRHTEHKRGRGKGPLSVPDQGPGQDAEDSREGKNTSFITGRENHLKHLPLIQKR